MNTLVILLNLPIRFIDIHLPPHSVILQLGTKCFTFQFRIPTLWKGVYWKEKRMRQRRSSEKPAITGSCPFKPTFKNQITVYFEKEGSQHFIGICSNKFLFILLQIRMSSGSFFCCRLQCLLGDLHLSWKKLKEDIEPFCFVGKNRTTAKTKCVGNNHIWEMNPCKSSLYENTLKVFTSQRLRYLAILRFHAILDGDEHLQHEQLHHEESRLQELFQFKEQNKTEIQKIQKPWSPHNLQLQMHSTIRIFHFVLA